MIRRLIKPLKSNSFFVFGARGAGKSTFIQAYLPASALYLDLLDPETFDKFLVEPKFLESLCAPKKHGWVIIDEVQKLPKLLDVVHRLIEKNKQKFALTGSSSRKLRRGAANLLAGRAFVNTLFPFTHTEMGQQFNLDHVLRWGSLPQVHNFKSESERRAYLRSYALTYIKEEIQSEQVVRRLEPFRDFLPIAAQCSGKILNFSAIAREVGVQTPTVQTYFQILEDTFLGFLLPHFHRSVRKSQKHAPKFYFFDNGVKKSLESSLDSIPTPRTAMYGELFEAFVIQEIFRYNHYFEKDYRLSYFRTKNDAEIDLILSRGRETILLEIKSGTRIDEVEVRKFARLAADFGAGAKAFLLSQDPDEYEVDGIKCLPWQKFFEGPDSLWK